MKHDAQDQRAEDRRVKPRPAIGPPANSAIYRRAEVDRQPVWISKRAAFELQKRINGPA